MRLSLHEVLAIVGRLDDAHGFDTPRERFRRFLLEQMTTASVARTFLDEAQQVLSEQYQRALQDTVLASGRLLGFETTFGDYERHGGAARHAGVWLSRRRLAVIVQLWSDDAATDVAAVARSLNVAPGLSDPNVAQSRLCVISATCSSRPRIEEAITLRREPARVVSVRSLMDLVTVARTPHVPHEEVLRMLHPSPGLEGSVSLLVRLTEKARGVPGVMPPRRDVTVAPRTCWVYVVREHEPGGHQATGVTDTLPMTLPAGDTPALAPGDALAFLVPSKGIVAQADVGVVAEDPAGGASESQVRFAIGLRNIVVVDPPTPVATEQRLNLELQAAVSQEPCVRVSKDEFEALIRHPPQPGDEVTASSEGRSADAVRP